jgi:hypothetical protein
MWRIAAQMLYKGYDRKGSVEEKISGRALEGLGAKTP